MRKYIPALAAFMGIGLAGCSSNESPVPVAETIPGSSSQSEQSPLDPYKPVHKRIGERAFWGCPSDTSDDCALIFKVTMISNVDPSECASYALEGKGDSRIVRVGVDAEVRKRMSDVSSASAVLNSQFWSGVSSDGYVTSVDPLYGCSGHTDSDYGPFYKELGVGQKARGVMDFAVPADSTKLTAAYFQNRGWEWDLPARAK